MRTRCRGCQRLTHVAEMLYVEVAGFLGWWCARCVEAERAKQRRIVNWIETGDPERGVTT